MKLSDAIWMGDSLKRPESSLWLSMDGQCGCAFGGALLAAGVSSKQFHKEWYGTIGGPSISELNCVKAIWPWLTERHTKEITYLYHAVCRNEKTIEDVAAYARSIEPAEPEYEPEEEYWSDADTTREMVNSIKGR